MLIQFSRFLLPILFRIFRNVFTVDLKKKYLNFRRKIRSFLNGYKSLTSLLISDERELYSSSSTRKAITVGNLYFLNDMVMLILRPTRKSFVLVIVI